MRESLNILDYDDDRFTLLWITTSQSTINPIKRLFLNDVRLLSKVLESLKFVFFILGFSASVKFIALIHLFLLRSRHSHSYFLRLDLQTLHLVYHLHLNILVDALVQSHGLHTLINSRVA